jgi:hypothetical protein
VGVAGFIGSLLLGANIYFVKRLIDKVERASDGHIVATEKVEKLSKDVNNLGTLFREFKTEIKTDLKQELKDFRRIEIDLGIIKAQMGSRTNGVKDA